MKYLLFINYNSGLKHNSIYENLPEIHESLIQLAEDEEINIEELKVPTIDDFKKHLDFNGDYCGILTNGTWYHLQTYPVFER